MIIPLTMYPVRKCGSLRGLLGAPSWLFLDSSAKVVEELSRQRSCDISALGLSLSFVTSPSVFCLSLQLSSNFSECQDPKRNLSFLVMFCFGVGNTQETCR